MRLLDWFRPGMRIKRWILMGIFGIACISFGLSFAVREIYMSLIERLLSVFLVLSGCIFIVISTRYVIKTFFHAISHSGFKMSLDSDRLSNLLFEKRILIKGPKIVTLGGGTGLSTMLRGLKAYSSNITAVVTVADDGGGSGLLREDLGMLPPGDIRNCVLALANTEPILEQLLQYRFKEGRLKDQNFGNLFLAAMDGISSSFEEAVRKMSDVLAVTGRVLPVTLDDVKLCAELEDGHIICGESRIGKHNTFHAGKDREGFSGALLGEAASGGPGRYCGGRRHYPGTWKPIYKHYTQPTGGRHLRRPKKIQRHKALCVQCYDPARRDGRLFGIRAHKGDGGAFLQGDYRLLRRQ